VPPATHPITKAHVIAVVVSLPGRTVQSRLTPSRSAWCGSPLRETLTTHASARSWTMVRRAGWSKVQQPERLSGL
jgi:hypothetical protein